MPQMFQGPLGGGGQDSGGEGEGEGEGGRGRGGEGRRGYNRQLVTVYPA